MVRSIIEDRNRNIWFATDSGVSRLDQFHKCFTNYSTAQGLANNFVRCIIEDKSANIWFATYGGGVSCLDRQQKLFTTFTTEQGLAYNVVRNIAEDSKGNLWFCTLGGGVSMLNQDRKFFTNYTASQGLINNYVWNLFEDKNGNLWFSTETGISRFDRKSFSSYTSAESMGNNMVGDMVIDKTGVIWMGTNKGFTALKGFVKNEKQGSDTLHKHVIPASNKISNDEIRILGFHPDFEIYNAKTGYPINDINLNGLFITHDDIIWAGTSDKLIRFDYSSLHKNPNPPNVFIQGLKVNNENVCWYDLAHDKQKIESLTIPPNITDEINLFGKPLSETEIDITRKKFKGVKFDSITRFYPLPVSLVLPYRHNNLTFDFAAIEPARPYLVRYEYMLEGYDKEWSPATDQTSAVFGNMYEGNYTFKLKAQSPDGVWSEPVAYTFRVLPPWYRTWWSFTLYALIFITALWRFIKWREKAIKKEAELKQQKTEFEMQALRAQMNPHFIFNSLNSISRYILKNQRVEANDYLTKFSKLIRMTLQHSAMPTIKLANEINMLQLYLELECLRFDKKITYEFQCDPHLDTELTEIPPLLLQPYVENAIWHGLMQKKEEGHLWIKMEQKEQYLVCTIADDGIGRNKTAELKPASTATHKSMG
jgi:two-component sensor histidine kinase